MTSINNQLSSMDELQMLTFSLDNVMYGVNVHQVREVKNFEGVTPVPYAPEYIKGVTNLRGEVIPVIDLRKRFGLADKKDETTNIMIIVQDKHPVGIMVDAVMEVLTLPKKDIETNSQNLIVDSTESVLGVAKHDQELIIMLDFLKLASREAANAKDDAKGFQVQVQNNPKP